MSEIRDELDPPFEILEPQTCQGPVLFNSPHSGSTYPRDFLAACRLDIATLRRSEDSFVDDLIAGVVRCGYPMMRAHFPRCFVDVNREPYELDPRMFEGRLPSFANTRSMRRRRLNVARGWRCPEIYDQRFRSTMPYSASKACTSHITGLCAGFSAVCIAISARQCWLIAIRCRQRPVTRTNDRGRNSCWAIDTVRVAWVWSPKRLKRRCGPSAIRSAATSLMRVGSSRSITAIRLPGCTRSSSSSTEPCIWMSGTTSDHPHSITWPLIWTPWPGGWPTSHWNSCAHIGPLPNKLKKGPLADASGPSLGRKRPRRAAVALATALQ